MPFAQKVQEDALVACGRYKVRSAGSLINAYVAGFWLLKRQKMRKPAAKKGRNTIYCGWKRRGWKKASRNDWEYDRGVMSPAIEPGCS